MNLSINKINTFTGHQGAIYDLHYGAGDRDLVSASGDGFLVKWHSPFQGFPLAKAQNPIYAFEVLPENDWVILGDNSEGLRIINYKEKKEIAFLELKRASVFDIKIHKRLGFAASSLGFVHIFDLKEKKFLKHIQVGNMSARCLAFNLERNEFAVGSSDNHIRVFDLKTFEEKRAFEAHQNSVFTMFYRSDLLYSAGRDAHIKVWGENFELIKSVPAHNYTINHIIPIEGTSLMASCSMDKAIKLWDISSLELLKVIVKGKQASHGSSVNRLLWRSETQTLFAGSDDQTISEWKLF